MARERDGPEAASPVPAGPAPAGPVPAGPVPAGPVPDAGRPGPSCTATRPIASLTGRRARLTWCARRRRAACPRWPSPITTACTECRSSPRRRRGCGRAASGSARSSALSSAWTWRGRAAGRAPGRRPAGRLRTAHRTGQAGTARAAFPTRRAGICSVLARDPEGYRRLCRVISAAQLAGGEKGLPVYDEAALADAHDGHWVILTGCRKGAVPAALAAARSRRPRRGAAPADRARSAATTSRSS